jgi:hypothetical protein
MGLELKSSYVEKTWNSQPWAQSHNTFLPAFFAAAQRAFAARERLLLPAALILRFDFCVSVPEEADRR